jgi:hypothetical protein
VDNVLQPAYLARARPRKNTSMMDALTWVIGVLALLKGKSSAIADLASVVDSFGVAES